MATKIVLNRKNAKVWLWNLSIQSYDSNLKLQIFNFSHFFCTVSEKHYAAKGANSRIKPLWTKSPKIWFCRLKVCQALLYNLIREKTFLEPEREMH